VLDQPFYAQGNIATAGGCLASQYLAAWILLRAASREDAVNALEYVAPVGEKLDYARRALANVEPYITASEIFTPAQAAVA
jgi:hypothetical protein